jgi:hypothetical protein
MFEGVGMQKWSTRPRVAAVLVGLVATILAFVAPPVSAAPILVVERNTWNVIGLDSNKPATEGPDTFPVGVSVCTTGDAPATDVAADFFWDETPSPLWVALAAGSPSTITRASLAAGECTDFYFNVEVVRDKNAQSTSRDYHIEVSSNETTTQSTPAGYEVFIEALVEQNRNSITSIVGPATVYVGKTYTYVLNADTQPTDMSRSSPSSTSPITSSRSNRSRSPTPRHRVEPATLCMRTPAHGIRTRRAQRTTHA